MLSGWSTKGKFAYPYCHKDTDYLWLRFGKKTLLHGTSSFFAVEPSLAHEQDELQQ